MVGPKIYLEGWQFRWSFVPRESFRNPHCEFYPPEGWVRTFPSGIRAVPFRFLNVFHRTKKKSGEPQKKVMIRHELDRNRFLDSEPPSVELPELNVPVFGRQTRSERLNRIVRQERNADPETEGHSGGCPSIDKRDALLTCAPRHAPGPCANHV